MLIRQIQLRNLLSYGSASQPVELGDLNVIIGPNGSGKSNLIEAIALLRNAPSKLLRPIADGGGGVHHWLWKGAQGIPVASIEAITHNPQGPQNLRYRLAFTETSQQRFELADERIENESPAGPEHEDPYFYYRFNKGRPTVNFREGSRDLRIEDVDLTQSILSQRRDPEHYPEITYLATAFEKIRLYREWSFGRYTVPRQPQQADLPNDWLEPDASNLGLVLNRMRGQPAVKRRLLGALQTLYEGIEDFDVQVQGGTVQVFFHERNYTIPATRLSDGTLRYLCLLAVLCHPEPPPLICIEEPELGLHPDVLVTLADLLQEASERTQIIVTTHSDVLVDALSDQPEAVLVADKSETGTELKRLDAVKLQPWLEKYRLGELWTSGELGGNRW